MRSRLPEGLLEVADSLAVLEPKRPRQASLRRAVSTAYYALFHLLVRAAVRRMFGNEAHRQEFGPYAARSYTHTALKAIAADTLKTTRPADLAPLLGTAPLSAELRTVCQVFIKAHAARETADYDLAAVHRRSETQALLRQVRDAFAAWEAIAASDEGTRFAIALSLLARGRKVG